MGGLFVIGIWLFFIIGWVMNTYKAIVGFIDAGTITEVSTVVWVQVLGIFTGPVGSVMGWLIW